MPSALEVIPFGGPCLNKDTGMEFITKIGQIILKARTGQQATSVHVDNSLDKVDPSFENALSLWKNGEPIHIHIFKKHEHTLLECWSISFENCERKFSERNKLDTTQLVLLLQSIYSQIRYLPLHSLINKNIILKEDVDYDITSYSSACSTDCFPVGLDLASNQFNSACTSFGKLNVSVAYDKTLEQVRLDECENTGNDENIEKCTPDQTVEEYKHTQQLKRKSSVLDSPHKYTPKYHHLSSFQGLTTLKEEQGDCMEINERDVNTSDDDGSIKINPSIRLSRPVSIPAASPIGNSPHDTFSHRFMEKHAYASKINATGVGLDRTVATRAIDPVRKPYNCHINLTPPPHSPLSPFKNSTHRSSHTNHPSNSGAMMPPRYGGRRSSLSCLNPSELFGSLVGSYEESILSGRMSTLPSKPINFTVQVGVLGKGKCKPSLKCPPHLNMEFPAYFYQHGNTDSPSPYVGTVDLENTKLRDAVDKRFPHGYRIPPKGQLQVIVKNPNKTAVKFFLIPYDFSDMPENSKTFLRQKSYSVPGPSNENQTLRYAIHLQFCSPSKKRIYLYKNIRVVFSHRAPDGSERLKVVCEGPGNPKYIPALNLNPMKNPVVKEVDLPDVAPPMDVNGNILTPFSAAEAFARREVRRGSITSTISESLLKIKLSEEKIRQEDFFDITEATVIQPNGTGFGCLDSSKVIPK
ncbi:hypothetical protein K7432_011957 [Basidiobolus ranarum]|uniref:Atos-like conserved domain-containing protein n=1 Tax=Basidiobolus ranarum TaxID=34480 RepID=A0ABR2VTW5_9FUNG